MLIWRFTLAASGRLGAIGSGHSLTGLSRLPPDTDNQATGDPFRPFSAGDRRQLQGRETTLRTTSKINAVGSHRAIAPNDQRDPCGRLPGTAAPIPDTRGEER
jgi:hypothetical protein